MSNTEYFRRDFLKQLSAALGGATLSPFLSSQSATGSSRPDRALEPPIAIASGFNGEPAVERAVRMMQNGADVLDSIIEGVSIQEEDPDDMTVGYGGVPNDQGVVQLDAGVMDGRTHRVGAVATLEDTMYPSKIARLVMERTDHAVLSGDGAQRFARMHGFEEQNLLTDEARERWLEWRETLSDDDNYIPPDDAEATQMGAKLFEMDRHHGTIHCSGLDTDGNLAAVTSTSGLFFKMHGRIADSPIAGAGYYTDNEAGAAGSTGRGEANLQNLSSYLIVERMRMGDSPTEACLEACQRIADHTRIERLLDEDGNPNFNVRFYAVSKDGQVGGAELRENGASMVAADAEGIHRIELDSLIPA